MHSRKESEFVPNLRSFLRGKMFDGYETGNIPQTLDDMIDIVDDAIRTDLEVVRARLALALISRENVL